MLRKINMFITIAILILFTDHLIAGSLGLLGADILINKIIARALVVLIVIHVGIASYLTYETLYATKRSGAGYFKENKEFWLRRLSGIVLIIPVIFHLVIFMNVTPEVYRLKAFTTARLISQIIMVLALAIHIMSNIKPLMIGSGIRSYKISMVDVLLILSGLLLLAGIAFVIYYLRWLAV